MFELYRPREHMINFRPFTLSEAVWIIRFCRQLINYALSSRDESEALKILPESVREKLEKTNYGVFVTIEKIVSSSMDGVYKRVVRGSVGALPSDEYTTLELLKLTAPGAALKDPRRTPLHKNELGSCVIEVMFVDLGREVSTDEIYSMFIPGYHIIVVEVENCKKVIMPHDVILVAESLLVERDHGLSMEELIDALFSRYDVPRRVNARLCATQIFYEVMPDGEVIERKLYLNKVFRKISGRHRQILAQASASMLL
ncbi:MAG: AMMECR1 domain-containing protein [Crenarchaeota archaeon]|nr:AMMECR1 domain-containing protein [Thermoproteota archaeon]